MRAFLAFETSPEVVDRLVEVEDELRGTRADVKLVEKENLHFSVKFLGEIPDDLVAEIDRRIGALTISKMEVGVHGLGAFPDLRRPRVVWAGVSERDREGVVALCTAAIKALEGVGKSDDRPYHPHITLGRVRSPRNQEALVSVIREYSNQDFGSSLVLALKLKSSTLTPNGPIYRDVREYPLQ
jgi:RNA 2',3'-cyclic 3'-phosphodiesterase